MAEGVKRKISAILKADVVGYSRLMETDEATTVDRISSYRKLITARIKEHHGRVVDSSGDELLAEFQTALDAVRCAVEIQQTLRYRNVDLPEDRRMQFRIGIHMGDVTVDGERLYGDTVNISARLEELAQPGAICVSGAVYDQVWNKLDVGFEDMGKQAVKNISDPVRVHEIVLDRPMAESPATGLFSSKPTIAVLAFDNMSNDPDNEHFSDGVSEDIQFRLSKSHGLDVIAPTSSYQFKGQNKDIRLIGEELNATHVLRGSVRKSGSRIRITAQLIGTDKGTNLWSEQYNRELTDVFEVQDEIAEAILNQLNIHLLGFAEGKKRSQNMEAYDAYLMGQYHLNHYDFLEGISSFERAVTLDPRFSDAFGALALSLNARIWMLEVPARNILPAITEFMDKALTLDPTQPEALIVKSVISFFVNRNYQRAIDGIADLLKTHPNNHNILHNCVFCFLAIGRNDIALRVSDRLANLDPLNPRVYVSRGRIFLLNSQFELARKAFERMEDLDGRPMPPWFADIAFLNGDKQGIQDQLNRKESEWTDYMHWYPCYEAAIKHLEGDSIAVKELLAPLWSYNGYIPFLLKSNMAALEDDIDRAIDYYSLALLEPEYVMFGDISVPGFISRVFPEYRSHSMYQKMLKDVSLDKESVAKLNIPLLPF